jgi:hypothetical protein
MKRTTRALLFATILALAGTILATWLQWHRIRVVWAISRATRAEEPRKTSEFAFLCQVAENEPALLDPYAGDRIVEDARRFVADKLKPPPPRVRVRYVSGKFSRFEEEEGAGFVTLEDGQEFPVAGQVLQEQGSVYAKLLSRMTGDVVTLHVRKGRVVDLERGIRPAQ